MVALFNPRIQRWDEHFTLDGAQIAGLTQIGRATVHTLRLNELNAVFFRATLIRSNSY